MGRKVLVVDDEKLIVKGIRYSLEQDDMEVDAAYDGEEALEMARRKAYDIILLDVMLGGISGFSMVRKLRKELNNPVPVIFLTAKDTENDLLTGFSAGGDDYISKPFSIHEVLARVGAVLRRRTVLSAGEDSSIKIGGIEIIPDRWFVQTVWTLCLLPRSMAFSICWFQVPAGFSRARTSFIACGRTILLCSNEP